MKKLTTLFIAILGVAFTASCGDDTDASNNDSSSNALTRAEAQTQVESGEADDDICLTNGFLDDGVCDAWCPGGDPDDCSVSNACTEGDTRPADDGCNTCVCTNNNWACTQIGCDPNNSNGGDACTDGDTRPADDGCNTCVCTNNNWACTQIGCDSNNSNGAGSIVIGECDEDTDPLDVTEIRTAKDTLEVDVGYSGGCEEHVITACWDGTFLESDPVQARIILEHDANGDVCEAYVSETLTFDLTPMRDSFESTYNATEGTIVFGIDGSSADYEF